MSGAVVPQRGKATRRQVNELRDHETDAGAVCMNVSTDAFPDAWAIVDRAMLPTLLSPRFGRWHAFGKGNRGANSSVYVACREAGAGNIRLHRVVLGLSRGDVLHVSHLNHNPFDNRRVNLEATTNRLNIRHGMNGVPARGYHFEKARQRWHAATLVAGRLVHLGRFATEAEAAAAYAAANVLLDKFDVVAPAGSVPDEATE